MADNGDRDFDQLFAKAQAFAVPRNRRWFPLLQAKSGRGVISWRVTGQDVTFLLDDAPRIAARYQLVGHLYHKENRWRWAWAEPDAIAEFCRDALVVRRYGEEHGIRRLTSPEWSGNPLMSSRFAAIAVMLNDGDGSFPLPLRHGVIDHVVLHSIRKMDASA
jgi:hypothetical protein